MTPLRYTLIQPLSHHQYLGKRFHYQDNCLKKEIDKLGSFKAEVLEFENLGEFFESIKLISNTENCAIILGEPIGIKPGERFHIRPESWFKEKLGKLERKDLLGVHLVNGTKVIGRFKENFEPSRIVLLDYDPDDHTPPDQVYKTQETYIEALCTLFGDFAHTGFVVTSSSSAGLISPTGELLSGNSPKRHAFFVVDNPSDIDRFRKALMFQSMKCDKSWQFKDKGGKVQTRYIFDANTFGSGRIVYEGRPQLNDGITQDRDPPRYLPGRSLNTRRLPSPTKQDVIDVHQEKGIGPRLTMDSVSGETRYTYDLSSNGERRPKLKKTTRFVRADDRYSVLTVKDFLASSDREWRIISEFRCDLSEAPNKSSISEVLLRSPNRDSCILYEFDGEITYCFRRNQKVREALHKQVMKDRIKPPPEQSVKSKVGGITPANDPCVAMGLGVTSKALYPGSLHLILGRPGQGKSRLATDLATQGRLVIFASASNEQSEEQYNNCPYPDKELLISRAYKLKRDYGVKVVLETSGDPFESPEPDEPATWQRLIEASMAKHLDHAQDIWKELGGGDCKPPIQNGVIIFTTFERARTWGRSGYFDIKKDTPYVTARCIRRSVLFVDDIDRESISNFRYITPDVQAWINRGQSSTGRQFDTVTTNQGNGYLVRQESQSVLRGFENLSTVFTTVEWRARMMLERLYPDRLHIHDLSPYDNAKDERTDLYLVGTPLVRAKYHALFHLLRELWRRQGIGWLWVGDGVQAPENHYTVRGKNIYREHDTIIKISQPHLNATDKCMLDLGLEDGNQNVAVAYAMLDQVIQGVGRNQGERYCDKRCVVLVDPQYLKVLDEFSGYHANVVKRVKDIKLADIVDEDVRYIVETLKRPATACGNGLTEGLPEWLRSHEGRRNRQKVEQAMQHCDSMTTKALRNHHDWVESMSSEVIQDALQGATWREIERRHNLGRKLGHKERLLLKQILKAVRFVLEAKRDIGPKYATLREFEQRRNWSRAITDPVVRRVLRAVLKSKIIGSSPV